MLPVSCLVFWSLTLGLTTEVSDTQLDVPFFRQQEGGCGASSVAMLIEYWRPDLAPDPEKIFSSLYSQDDKGISAKRLRDYLETQGFRTFVFRGDLVELRRHLAKGRPLIVCLKHGSSLHYAVVVGLDSARRLVLLNDPAVKKLSHVDEDDFLKGWRAMDNWTLLALPVH